MKKKISIVLAGVLCAASLFAGAAARDVIQEIRAQLRPDFTVKIDGSVRNFKNVQGETVEPILYEGTTYLPLRAISEIMGKTVYWYEDNKLIDIKDAKETTVTDADVIIDSKAKKEKEEKAEKPAVDTSGFVGEDKAKAIALEKAGLAEADVTFVKVELDQDNGVWQYEVEFKKERTEYNADIKADDGKIIDWEVDIDD